MSYYINLMTNSNKTKDKLSLNSRISSAFTTVRQTFKLGPHTTLITLAFFIGILSGAANMLFRTCLELSRHLFMENMAELFSIDKGLPYRILIPLIPVSGAILIAVLAMRFPGEVMGYGFPSFLERVNLRDGIIRLRTVILKIIAPSLTIGSGGSAGVEGPIAQIGGGIGSLIGQLFRVSGNRMKLLIAAGSAGGIAATFNAPIAGVMFATEIVLLGNFELTSFGAIVVSAGMATAVSRIYYGPNPVFSVPEYTLTGLWELPFYILLGLLIGPLAVFYIKIFYKTKWYFQNLHINEYIKPIIGAFIVGTIAIVFPHIMSDGYEYIERALRGEMFWLLMCVLVFLKIFATSITLGSGGAGGVFAPALFIGAMAGGTFGAIAHHIFPSITSSAGAYATVGVGAFLAAVTHAPLTGMFLLFEMTGNYQIIIPIMLSATIGTFVSHRLSRNSIDTYELAMRGINLHAGREMTILHSVRVKDVMRRDFTTVRDKVNLKEFIELVIEGPGGFYYPVVNGKGEMIGIISLQDVRKVLFEDYIKEIVTVGQLCSEDVKVLYPEDTLAKALNHFAEMDIDEIPVVDPNNPKKVIGMLRRGDVVAIYNREVLRRQAE